MRWQPAAAAASNASVQQQLRERQVQDHLRRAQAMLELKRNTDKAMAELQGANERSSLRRRKEADLQRAEFDKIIAEGGNPYEVFRRRRLNAQATQQRHRLEEKVKQSEMNIAERMLAHDDYSRKKDKLVKRDRELSPPTGSQNGACPSALLPRSPPEDRQGSAS